MSKRLNILARLVAVAFAVGSLIAIAAGGWKFYKARLEEERASAEHLFNSKVSHNIDGAKLLNAGHDEVFSGSRSWWFRFSIPSTQVTEYEYRCESNWISDRQNAVLKDGASHYFADQGAPAWWHPEKLSSADTFDFEPYPPMWLAISRTTGEAYLFRSRH